MRRVERFRRWARRRYRVPASARHAGQWRAMLVLLDVAAVGLWALFGLGVWYLVTGWKS